MMNCNDHERVVLFKKSGEEIPWFLESYMESSSQPIDLQIFEEDSDDLIEQASRVGAICNADWMICSKQFNKEAFQKISRENSQNS